MVQDLLDDAPTPMTAAPAIATPSEVAGPDASLIGQMLIARQLVGTADLERALELQAGMGGRIGSLLVRIGALSEEQLLAVLSEQLGFALAGRDVALPEPDAWVVPGEEPVPVDWMQDRGVLLWQDPEGGVICASRDPLDPALREAIDYLFPQLPVRHVLAPAQLMENTLDKLANGLLAATQGGDDVRHLRELAEEAPVVELVNSLLAQAVEQRASDIHLEPGEHEFVVRFRIDGVLYTRLQLPRERFNAVVSA